MKASPRISHVLLAMLALTAFMFNSLPGTDACQTDTGHGSDEVMAEAHCLCAHGMESAKVPYSLVTGMAECGTGCACIPARSQWQNQLAGRIQWDPQGKERVSFNNWDPRAAYASLKLRPGNIVRIGPALQPFNATLRFLRTIVLLT